MPLYDAVCNGCQHEFEYFQSIAKRHQTPKCPQCGSFLTHKIMSQMRARCLDAGWASENGGRGRYIGQLANTIDKRDPNAYCRSRAELFEKARRAGCKVVDRL